MLGGKNMSRKVFVGNYKGGVGKTTSTYNIAVELAKNYGKKVLLVDLDSQSSLSEVCMTAFGRPLDELGKDETLNYVYKVYMQAKKIGNINFSLKCDKVIKSANSIDFIPNSLFSVFGGLDKIAIDIGNSIQNLLVLRDLIEENKLNDRYDFIFFDCPPSNNVITQSAFLYSDYYLIPTIMDPLSIRGVRHYISVIRQFYHSYCVANESAEVLSLVFGNEPELIGVFEAIRKGSSNTDIYREQMASLGYLFQTIIKDRKNVSEAMGAGNEINNFEYSGLVKEFLTRLESMDSIDTINAINTINSKENPPARAENETE